MIDRTALSKVSRIKGITNLDHASKDYFQEMVLLSISREFPDLVFKGGTCLSKFYGLDRFSEDLDLNGGFEREGFSKICEYIADFGYQNEVTVREMVTGFLSTFRIRGFLYNGEEVSLTRVNVDITVKDETVLPVKWLTFHSLYPDIPSFTIGTMDEKEIIAEKFRALFQRSKARDLYDVCFLLERGVSFDPDLALKKLTAYAIEPDLAVFRSSLKRIIDSWERELKASLGRVPPVKDRSDRALLLFSLVQAKRNGPSIGSGPRKG